jgi:hypothetical protein
MQVYCLYCLYLHLGEVVLRKGCWAVMGMTGWQQMDLRELYRHLAFQNLEIQCRARFRPDWERVCLQLCKIFTIHSGASC